MFSSVLYFGFLLRDDLHQQTHYEDTQDVKEEDPVESLLRSLWNDFARILGLCPRQRNDLDISIAEGCTDQRGPKC